MIENNKMQSVAQATLNLWKCVRSKRGFSPFSGRGGLRNHCELKNRTKKFFSQPNEHDLIFLLVCLPMAVINAINRHPPCACCWEEHEGWVRALCIKLNCHKSQKNSRGRRMLLAKGCRRTVQWLVFFLIQAEVEGQTSESQMHQVDCTAFLNFTSTAHNPAIEFNF